MPSGTRLEDLECWPDVLDQVSELNAQGFSRNKIGAVIGEEFKISLTAFFYAVQRGDIPALPSSDPIRAAARRSGAPNFDGAPCRRCKSTLRRVSDGMCVECERRYREQRRKSSS
jgi:hypothetical protein